MSANEHHQLVGLYRARPEPPGFAICVFSNDTGVLCVQEASEGGLVSRFFPCDAERGELQTGPIGEPGYEPVVSEVGSAMLFAFQRTDGSFVIGTRTTVESAVRDELINLWKFPFVFAEAARFVGDQDAILRAEKATARLLKNPRWDRQTVGPFVAGESKREGVRLDEKNHVEEPLLEHLDRLGWTVVRLDMHQQTTADTGRRDFSQVVLEKRLADAICAINDWMEPDQVEEVVRRLCDFQSPSLMENNKQVLKWITEGTGVAENRKTGERSPTVRIVDFSPDSTKNDWLAVSQFKVRIPGRDQHIIADVVLFLNGLPVVLFECKSPKVQEPTAEAIDQILRYSEQRGASGEGNPALFY
ncbi:MAG: type I restriction endonuclease [Verrucomicrobiota bacterium]